MRREFKPCIVSEEVILSSGGDYYAILKKILDLNGKKKLFSNTRKKSIIILAFLHERKF